MITITINVRKIARFLLSILLSLASVATFLFSGLILIRMRHWWSIIGLTVTKTVAASSAIPLAIWGMLLFVAGVWRRSIGMMTFAGLGAAIAGWYSYVVTRPHDGFDRAFGSGWQQRIPEDLSKRMLQSRLHLLPPRARSGVFHRNMPVGRTLDSDEPLLADVWEPPADVPRTGLALLYLHGGAWHYGDKDLGTRYFFRHLINQGHVVLDLSYTMAHKAQLPAMVGDVKEAIVWLKRHAPRYGIDEDRIVVAGGSAGAHLALLTAYTPNQPQFQPNNITDDTSVRAVVALYPPVDLRAIQVRSEVKYGQLFKPDSFLSRVLDRAGAYPLGLIPKLLGGLPDEVPDVYAMGSPVNHVSAECPPTLVIQGSHDVFDWLNDTRYFVQKLRAAGVATVYVELPNTDHAFDLLLPRISPATQAAFYDIDRFLALMV